MNSENDLNNEDKGIDNILLFNTITHYDDGTVDDKLFSKLLKNFEKYVFFKDIISDEIDIKKALANDDEIIFRIGFKNKKIRKEFIKKNKDKLLKFKKKKYLLTIDKLDDEFIEIYFNLIKKDE